MSRMQWLYTSFWSIHLLSLFFPLVAALPVNSNRHKQCDQHQFACFYECENCLLSNLGAGGRIMRRWSGFCISIAALPFRVCMDSIITCFLSYKCLADRRCQKRSTSINKSLVKLRLHFTVAELLSQAIDIIHFQKNEFVYFISYFIKEWRQTNVLDIFIKF